MLASVEPFSVTCETCHARLKVRSESVVGEIHACPKCGSMVHILPPTGSVIVGPQSPTSPSAEFDPLPALAAPEAVAPSFEDIEAAATAAAPVAATGSSVMLWGIGGAVLILIGGLAAAVWLGGNDSTDEPTSVAARAAATTPVDQQRLANDVEAGNGDPLARDPYAVDAAAPVDDSRATASTEPPVKPLAAIEAEQPPATSATPDSPATDSDPANTANRPPPEAVGAALPSVAGSESRPNGTPPAPSTRRREPVLKFDPLDFDPTQLSLGDGGSPTPSSGSIAGDPAVETDADAASSVDEAANGLALPPPAVDRTLSMRLGPMPSGVAPPNVAAKRLGLPVESLDVADVPLAQFIETISDLAGAPITVDPVALELAGVSPRQIVSVQARDVTLEELLKDALSKQRLELVERAGRLGVALVDADRRSTKVYEVKDLAGAGGAKQIRMLIEQFVAPESWRSAGGEGTIEVDGTKLRVTQSRAHHHQVLVFCERLRLARGLAVRSRYPAELLSIEPPYARIAAKLYQRTIFTFLPWTRLADVVRHWEEASGLTILVDWSALADVELAPASPIACSAIDRTWADVLDGVLAPIGLGWRPVDGETIQITTREALAEIQRIEFYPVPKQLRDQFASNDALIKSLERKWQQRSGGKHAGLPDVQFSVDEPSGRVIALAPPDVHRHLGTLLKAE